MADPNKQSQQAAPQAQTALPTQTQPTAPVGERYYLVHGRAAILRQNATGKYRGLLSVDPDTGDGVSIYWTKETKEIALSEATLRECQADPEILVVPIREITKAEADAHVAGPAVAAELAKVEGLSVEALEAEIARRKAAAAIAAKNGRGN